MMINISRNLYYENNLIKPLTKKKKTCNPTKYVDAHAIFQKYYVRL